MVQTIVVDLTLDEKKSILHKILSHKNRGKLKNIRSVCIEEIHYYSAEFVDSGGTKIEFICSTYRDYGPQRGPSGLKVMDMAIGWNDCATHFVSGGGEIFDSISELLNYLKSVCSVTTKKAKDTLLN